MFVAGRRCGRRCSATSAVGDPDVDTVLVNRFYLRGVEQIDKRTGVEAPEAARAAAAAAAIYLAGPIRARSRSGESPRRVPVDRCRAVVFDVGETLVDETRAWSRVGRLARDPAADVPRRAAARSSSAAATIASRFGSSGPGSTSATRFAKREAAGVPDDVRAEDLYPDAVPCLRALRDAGYRVGVVGNQPARAEAALRRARPAARPRGVVGEPGASTSRIRAFFARIADELGLPAGEIAYVGDRLDNDVRPAAAAGMAAIFIRRGPWALDPGAAGDPPEATPTIDEPDELPAALARIG